jgi:hypothetical protein
MQVTITRTIDYTLNVADTDPLVAARSAMALFGAMSPETRDLHIDHVEECYVTTGTLEEDCKVFDLKDIERTDDSFSVSREPWGYGEDLDDDYPVQASVKQSK